MCDGGHVLSDIVTTKARLVTGRKRVLGHPPAACAGGPVGKCAHLASIGEKQNLAILLSLNVLIALLFTRHVMISSADLEVRQY